MTLVPTLFYVSSNISQTLTYLSDALETPLQITDPQANPMQNGSILFRAISRTQFELSFLSHLGNIPVVSKPDKIQNIKVNGIYSSVFPETTNTCYECLSVNSA